MSMSYKSPHKTPPSTKHCQNIYCSPSRRNKNIRTVADVPLSHNKNSNNKNKQKHSICCICLESMDISDIGSLDSCSHKYHRDCIISWSSIENACPLCKIRFNTIIDISNNNKLIPIQKKVQQPSYHIDLGNIIWLDCICTYCGSDDNEHLLLLCDGCDDAAHTYCIGLGDNVPETSYYCQKCQLQMAEIYNTNTINISENKSENLSQIDSDDSDEEYKPTPKPKRIKKKKKKVKKTTMRFGSNNLSDEEYIPPNSINLCTNTTVQTRRQRLQINSEESNPIISTLDHLPVSFTRNNNKNICTQKMVVIDQNNNRHVLGLIKKKRNKISKRSSLANLFSDNMNGYNSCNSFADLNKNNKYEISDNSEDSEVNINSNNKNRNKNIRIKRGSDSEYKPSDNDTSDNDFDLKINRKRNRKRKYKCNNGTLRRSQRLRKQQLDLLSDEESENENGMNKRYKCKKNNRKRSLRQLEDFNDCNVNVSDRKRMKFNDMKYRRYSSLSLL